MRKDVFLLFGLALAARALSSLLKVYYGVHNIELFFTVTAWNDFYVTYVQWLRFLAQGMLPYRDFLTYTYPPLFLYALYPFYLLGGANAASIPIVVSDAGTSALVYLLASRLTSRRIALAAGLIYAFCPLALFYEGYLWLSSQPMAFFLVLSVYFMRTEKPTASFAAYAISIMFKQEAFFILPVFIAWQVKKYRRRIWKGIGLLASIVLLVSLPFLLLLGGQYIQFLGYQLLGTPSLAGTIAAGSTVAASSPIVLKPCPSILPTASASFGCIRYPNPLLTFLITSFGWISDALVVPLLILSGAALFLSRQVRGVVELLLSYSMVCFLVIFSMTVHALAAYYFVPFYALMLSSAKTRWALLVPLLASAATMLIPTGNFTLVMALAALLAMVALLDQQYVPRRPIGVP